MFGNANAIDVSNWQAALVGRIDLVRATKADGLRAAWIGCNSYSLAAGLCETFRAAGVFVYAGYCFTYWGQPEKTAAERANAIRLAEVYDLPAVVGDAEWWSVGAPTTHAQRAAIFRQTRDLVEGAGREFVVYTGASYWNDFMGTAEFARHKLIHANYPYSLRAIEDVNFGGWRKAAGHQFSSTGTDTFLGPAPTIPGSSITVDYCHFFDPALLGADAEDQPMTPAEREEFESLKSRVAAMAALQDRFERSVFSGGEFPPDYPLADRRRDTGYRISAIVDGYVDPASGERKFEASVAERASSALALAKDHAVKAQEDGAYTPDEVIAEIIDRLDG